MFERNTGEDSARGRWAPAAVFAAVVAATALGGTTESARANSWNGFDVSVLPSRAIAAGDAPGWSLAVTNDLGGPGVDVWNNNHGFMSEAIIDLGGNTTVRTAQDFGSPITSGPDSHGVAFSDIDGDGDEDFLEVSGRNSPNRLFRNDGGVLVSIDAGALIDEFGRGRQPLFADFDGDGDMDVLIANLDLRSDPVPQEERQFIPSDLYLNNGDGTVWTKVADPNQVIDDGHIRMAQLTSTGPGTPTIAVTHDVFRLAKDSIAIGTPTLQNAANPAMTRTDVTLPIREVIVGDFDGDLFPEFIIFAGNESESAGEWPVTAAEVVGSSPRSVTLPRSADLDNCRSGAAADFDNDGDLDILAGCTQVEEGQDRNVLLLNDGSGNFSDGGTAVLPRTTTETASAIVTADINADGWMDAIVANGYDFDRAVDHVLTNEGGVGNWLRIDVEGSNADGIGAQVFVGTDHWQVRENGHSTHRAQDERTMHFGLGQATAIAPVEIRWPDGTYETCTVSGINRTVTITQGAANCQAQSRTGLLAELGSTPMVAALKCDGRTVTVNIAAGHSPTNGDDVILGTPNDDTINGLGGNDVICGGGGDDFINGGAGNDRILGEAGNDKLAGGSGNDTVIANNGNDELFGGTGNDLLDGGAGNDVLSGAAGNDVLAGGSGADRALGGADDDRLNGGSGSDELLGLFGDDIISGGSEPDVVSGGAGDDVVAGGAGNDFVAGGAGDDVVHGGDGDDRVNGGSGSDKLDGLNGTDRFDGGTGDDQCVVRGLSEVRVSCERS